MLACRALEASESRLAAAHSRLEEVTHAEQDLRSRLDTALQNLEVIPYKCKAGGLQLRHE